MHVCVRACVRVCVCVCVCVCEYTDSSVGPTHVVHLLGDPTKPVGDVGCKDNPTQLVSPTQHPQSLTTLSRAVVRVVGVGTGGVDRWEGGGGDRGRGKQVIYSVRIPVVEWW